MIRCVRVLAARPNLEVSDVAVALRWFEPFGLVAVTTMGDPPEFALVGHHGQVLSALGAAEEPAVPAIASCYIEVKGIEELHDLVQRLGFELSHPLTTHPWGMTDLVVRGPDGHQLTFGERTG
jgi:Glyoxalase/Bleomycin resistance protein/Dioxygenase superfamily